MFTWNPPRSYDSIDNNLINIGQNSSRQLVRAESRGFGILERTVEHDLESCRVTWIQQVDIKGNVPTKVMDRVIPRSLEAALSVREKFNQDDKIDRIEREKLMSIMLSGDDEEGGEVYDESEMQSITNVQKQMKKASDSAFRPLNR